MWNIVALRRKGNPYFVERRLFLILFEEFSGEVFLWHPKSVFVFALSMLYESTAVARPHSGFVGPQIEQYEGDLSNRFTYKQKTTLY